jgi:hypothetical protein
MATADPAGAFLCAQLRVQSLLVGPDGQVRPSPEFGACSVGGSLVPPESARDSRA